MNPGAMREQITLLTLTRSSDGAGGTSVTTSTFATLAASLRPLKADRIVENTRIRFVTPYEVIIRYNAAEMPAVDMIVVFRNEQYVINEIQDTDPYRRYIRMIVTKQ